MIPLRARIHRLIVAALLAAYAAWFQVRGFETRTAWGVGYGVLLLAVSVGAWLRRRWAVWFIYVISAATVLLMIVASVFWYVRFNGAERISAAPSLKTVITFAPAAVLCLLAGYCSYVARRYLRR